MTGINYEIRICQSCGMRYPLVANHSFGERCPSCLGTTAAVAIYRIDHQSVPLANKPIFQVEVLLDNLRSAWNVGSIFRTADGLGVSKLHLCGITPTPDNASVTKTSLGAEETVEWEYSRNAVKSAKKLKDAGYGLIALEQDKRAIGIAEYQPLQPVSRFQALVIGNEVTGIDPDLLDLCDHLVQIPMRGQKKSFNVEVAFAIAAYLLYSPT